MIRTRLLAIASIVAAVAMVATTSASALFVRPAKAPMLDASGATNGCELKVADFFTPPTGKVRANVRVVCPESAGVHRITFEWGVWEVMADGSLREVDPYQLKARTGSVDVISGTTRVAAAIVGCASPANAGTHTWLIRARVNVKQTLDNSDPNPFFARVDRVETITC